MRKKEAMHDLLYKCSAINVRNLVIWVKKIDQIQRKESSGEIKKIDHNKWKKSSRVNVRIDDQLKYEISTKRYRSKWKLGFLLSQRVV